MARFYLLACTFVMALCAHAQNKAPKPEDEIRKFYFVLLRKWPHRGQDSATAAKIQASHLANIHRLYDEGKLKVAGPFVQEDSHGGEDGDWQGIFIFDCATQDAVDSLLKSDPAIAAGRLTYEIHSWHTSAIGSFKPGKPSPPAPLH